MDILNKFLEQNISMNLFPNFNFYFWNLIKLQVKSPLKIFHIVLTCCLNLSFEHTYFVIRIHELKKNRSEI
jgi:hypothetical protein